jgi:hypothetical protein
MWRSRGLSRPPRAGTGSGARAPVVERLSYGAAVLGRGSPCAIEGRLSLGSLEPRAPSSVRRIRSASLRRMNGVARSNSTRPPPVHARRSSGSNTIDSFLGGDDPGVSVTTQVRNRTVSWMSQGAKPFVRPSSGPSRAPCLRGLKGAVPPMGRGAGACSPRPHRPRDRAPVGGVTHSLVAMPDAPLRVVGLVYWAVLGPVAFSSWSVWSIRRGEAGREALPPTACRRGTPPSSSQGCTRPARICGATAPRAPRR